MADSAAGGGSNPGSVLSQLDMASANRNPLRMLADILKDSALTVEDKRIIVDLWKARFHHRRRMAYISLGALLALLAIALWVVLVPWPEAAKSNLVVMKDHIVWLASFFMAIVLAYFGISGFKPAS